MARRFVVLGLSVLAVALPRPQSARAAEVEVVPPPGFHTVRHEVFVDLGAYAGCVTWRYAVRDGDTLGEIAARELGSARRLREILALNPSLRPAHLGIGTKLVMPTRSPACARDDARYVFFAWTPEGGPWSAPRRLGGEEPERLGDGARVYALPYRRLDAVLDASDGPALDGRALAADPYVARSDPIHTSAWVPERDPTVRILTSYRVRGMEGRHLLLDRTAEARFDAAGGRLAPPAPVRHGPPTLLLLLTLALMVACFANALARASRVRALGTPSEEDGAADADVESGVGVAETPGGDAEPA